MNAPASRPGRDALLELAQDPRTTPFDYVVVGSGAGGGPLAARLALHGRRVLLVEAGVDGALEAGDPAPGATGERSAAEKLREVYAVPGYHAAATEDREFGWEFSIRHYGDDAQQKRDSKYARERDPSSDGQGPDRVKGGIFYPRAAALGGCTSHHAMIIIRPNDADWDALAESTDDASWRSGNMQGYFAKIEKCLYYAVYRGFAGKLLGGLLRTVQAVATLINPRRQLDPGGHGFAGWQPTSFIDPLVIASIAWRDRTFLRLLAGVVFFALARRGERSLFGRSLARLQLLQFLDPNVRSPEIPTRHHLMLLSIGTDGKRREGLREHLLEVARRCPDRLVLLNPAQATRVLFEAAPAGGTAPRAAGVEVLLGAHLYRASPKAAPGGESPRPQVRQVFARSEVILCGGTFNTPQLLMLSGIGDLGHLSSHRLQGPSDREGRPVAGIVHLPGVGSNLQDRYEISVISQAAAPFKTLEGATFQPGTAGDRAREQWLQDKGGLYSTNGGAIAMMLSSKAHGERRTDPDLFVFGLPIAFRGYYWGWSRELLSKARGAPADSRDLWTWVILKAYADNHRGEVRLAGADPLEMPRIDFNSFPGGPGTTGDLDALCEAVQVMREMNAEIGVLQDGAGEIQPGKEKLDDSPELRQWIRDEAWGHHACGTCRIGSDAWQEDPANLQDRMAVIDSAFRVHGVRGLRVVDASVFPRSPGYFIVAPTMMVSEKAADVLLADVEDYPERLETLEAAAVRERRRIANVAGVETGARDASRLPADTIGLALSGGGIRSATFCLGVLQALAARGRLREIDVVSSVSGGGYIASFLGRLYTRLADDVRDKPGRVEAILTNGNSPEIDWLRGHASYIEGGSRSDAMNDIAAVLRNLASVHLWIGTLLFGVFALLRGAAQWFGMEQSAPTLLGVSLSAWWWVPVALFGLGVLPSAGGYWLVLRDARRNVRALLPFVMWLVLLGAAVVGFAVSAVQSWSVAIIVVLVLSWLVQEVASWGVPVETARPKWGRPPDADESPGVANTNSVRNRLTRLLGTVLFGLVVSALWVALDTAARYLAQKWLAQVGWSMLGLAPVLPLLRGVATQALKLQRGTTPSGGLAMQTIVGLLTFALAFLLLLGLDTLAHHAFDAGAAVGNWCLAGALLASAAVGRIHLFLNLSSLQQAYSQKLVRTFLGASNDVRVHPSGTNAPLPVNISHPDDDIDFDDYHPEQSGGPLHLVQTCVNNTVDPLSGNQLRNDQGMPMCTGPAGLSVGRRFHAIWDKRTPETPRRRSPVTPLRVAPDPHQFHVLARRTGEGPTQVERLRLGQWTAISGAAFTTGSGRDTRLARSLLLGLLNVRLGYWWDSGLAAGNRPGRFPPSLWRRIKSLPSTVFHLQATLLNEWRAYFAGPAEQLWYLSDGGHFDNTGLYELIRRRLPIIIAVDASRDDQYTLDDLALLTRQVRLDFGATIDWLEPTGRASTPPVTGWGAFSVKSPPAAIPPWITRCVDPEAIAGLGDLRRTGPLGAALARVAYADDPSHASWLLLIKPCLLAKLPTDVHTYAAVHDAFPHQTTLDQFFDDNQWESYRMLGESQARKVLL